MDGSVFDDESCVRVNAVIAGSQCEPAALDENLAVAVDGVIGCGIIAVARGA